MSWQKEEHYRTRCFGRSKTGNNAAGEGGVVRSFAVRGQVPLLGRRMDTQGEVLVWCRKCSGYARQRMGSKLMNGCKPEQMGTLDVEEVASP